MRTTANLAVDEANATIADQLKTVPELTGMGTTLTAIWFAGKTGVLMHIGGSRAYLLRRGELTQITQDEFWVGPNVNRGGFPPLSVRSRCDG